MKGQSYAQVRKKLKRKIKSASNKHKKMIKWADEKTNASEQVTLERKHNLMTQTKSAVDMEYNAMEAIVLAQFMKEIDNQGFSFIQQYFLDKGLRKFGDRGHAAAYKEVKQLNNRDTFKPLAIGEMTPQEKRKAMEALLFLAEKQDGTIKGRQVYNGKPTQEWLSKEDAASPTVSLESIMLLAAIDAYKKRDNMTVDIPNAFIQMPLEQSDGNK